MQNPFVYGEVVPAAAFVDRVDELDRLVRDLTSGQKVFLISPRRYGKSSLIRQALTTRGPALVEAVVDQNEPPMPPKVSFKEARHLAESLARGTPAAGEIAKTIAANVVRELV